jgi:superfamily II RNA helicase
MEKVRHRLWADFNRHLRFLRETNFVDSANQLTTDGLWASNLRVDQPLLIAECIRRGAFDGVTPRILPSLLAPFVLDRSSEVKLDFSQLRKLNVIERHFKRTVRTIDGLKRQQLRQGFDSPPLEIWPAYGLYLWAGQASWETLLKTITVNEGDMASLILRTADHLRQIVSLKESHPHLSNIAADAIPLILREPVLI